MTALAGQGRLAGCQKDKRPLTTWINATQLACCPLKSSPIELEATACRAKVWQLSMHVQIYLFFLQFINMKLRHIFNDGLPTPRLGHDGSPQLCSIVADKVQPLRMVFPTILRRALQAYGATLNGPASFYMAENLDGRLSRFNCVSRASPQRGMHNVEQGFQTASQLFSGFSLCRGCDVSGCSSCSY